MPRSVLIVTNGNREIGFGHVSRTVGVAREFSGSGWSVSFLVDEHFEFGDGVGPFPCYRAGFWDASLRARTEGVLEDGEVDVVLIDLVEDEYRLFRFLQGAPRPVFIVSVTLFLFGLSSRYERLSLFPSIDRFEYSGVGEASRTRVIAGPEFFSVRKEFFNVEYSVKERAERVLVSAGGTDPFSITKKVVESLKGKGLEVTVLLSPRSADYRELFRFCGENEGFCLKGFVEDMPGEMKGADLLVLNGGLTRYEACAVGLPFVAISIHDVQKGITDGVASKGAGLSLGTIGELSPGEISGAVEGLLGSYSKRREMSEKGKGLFAGIHPGPSSIYELINGEYLNFKGFEGTDKNGEALPEA